MKTNVNAEIAEKSNRELLKLVKSQMKSEFTSISNVISFIHKNMNEAFVEAFSRKYGKTSRKDLTTKRLLETALNGFKFVNESAKVLQLKKDFVDPETKLIQRFTYIEKTAYTLSQVLSAILQPSKTKEVHVIGESYTKTIEVQTVTTVATNKDKHTANKASAKEATKKAA